MIRLELTQEEHDLLLEILREFLSNLRMEIVDTDSVDYKDTLRHEKGVVTELMRKVNEAVAEPSQA